MKWVTGLCLYKIPTVKVVKSTQRTSVLMPLGMMRNGGGELCYPIEERKW